ncbi:hypothetical protein GE21DRAFT_1001422 [Neurospora crassa]|nr:hypothetical protein GE21DRAFT_1001422 [Neurospora crassa]
MALLACLVVAGETHGGQVVIRCKWFGTFKECVTDAAKGSSASQVASRHGQFNRELLVKRRTKTGRVRKRSEEFHSTT